MSEALEEMYLFGEEKMEKAVAQMNREFASVRTGRANPAILDRVAVDYYGAPTPIRQMAQVSVSEGVTLVITPFDKSIMKELEKAIIKAELGVAPNNDGTCVRLNFPPLTEERRKELYKESRNSTTVVKGKKIGRNDPCPCGSGKKYKKCCGKN